MSATLLGTTKPLVEEFELALLDLDGVCYSGADPVVHATDSVMAAKGQGLRTCFVTNNASRTPAQVVAKLAGFGIEADEQQIYTAAMDAVALLAEHVPAPATVLVVGGAGVEQALTEAGYTTTRSALDNPAAVVQGYDPSVDWAAMSEAAYAITNGALHVATNLDSTLPTERGFALGNGSLVAAVVHATERQPLAAGKPFAGIYTRAIARSGGGKAIAVGDRLNTDHAGARQSSLPSLHVLTGVASARDVLLAPPQYRPTFLHTDLRGLLEPAPAPQRIDDGWLMGDAVAKVENGAVTLSFDGKNVELGGQSVTLSLNAYRAAAVAAWDLADQGQTLSNLPDITVAEAR